MINTFKIPDIIHITYSISFNYFSNILRFLKFFHFIQLLLINSTTKTCMSVDPWFVPYCRILIWTTNILPKWRLFSLVSTYLNCLLIVWLLIVKPLQLWLSERRILVCNKYIGRSTKGLDIMYICTRIPFELNLTRAKPGLHGKLLYCITTLHELVWWIIVHLYSCKLKI